MIVSMQTFYCEKGGFGELRQYFKSHPIPGLKWRILRPQSGRMDTFIVETEFGSAAEEESFWQKAEMPSGLGEVWRRCVKRREVQQFLVDE